MKGEDLFPFWAYHLFLFFTDVREFQGNKFILIQSLPFFNHVFSPENYHPQVWIISILIFEPLIFPHHVTMLHLTRSKRDVLDIWQTTVKFPFSCAAISPSSLQFGCLNPSSMKRKYTCFNANMSSFVNFDVWSTILWIYVCTLYTQKSVFACSFMYAVYSVHRRKGITNYSTVCEVNTVQWAMYELMLLFTFSVLFQFVR